MNLFFISNCQQHISCFCRTGIIQQTIRILGVNSGISLIVPFLCHGFSICSRVRNGRQIFYVRHLGIHPQCHSVFCNLCDLSRISKETIFVITAEEGQQIYKPAFAIIRKQIGTILVHTSHNAVTRGCNGFGTVHGKQFLHQFLIFLPLVDQPLELGRIAGVLQREHGLSDIYRIIFIHQNIFNRSGISRCAPGTENIQFSGSQTVSILGCDSHLSPNGIIVIVNGDGQYTFQIGLYPAIHFRPIREDHTNGIAHIQGRFPLDLDRHHIIQR